MPATIWCPAERRRWQITSCPKPPICHTYSWLCYWVWAANWDSVHARPVLYKEGHRLAGWHIVTWHCRAKATTINCLLCKDGDRWTGDILFNCGPKTTFDGISTMYRQCQINKITYWDLERVENILNTVITYWCMI